MSEKQVSFNINDGETFFADEVSITNNPIKFFFDFKNASPRIDVRVQQTGLPILLKHNTIMLDAWLAKTFHELLGDHIEKYEKQYGKITEPKQLKKAKEHPITTTEPGKPGYFG